MYSSKWKTYIWWCCSITHAKINTNANLEQSSNCRQYVSELIIVRYIKILKHLKIFLEIFLILWNFSFKGCGCTLFCDISQKTHKSMNNLKDLNYYIVIGSDDNFCNYSAPILINKPIIRSAFGIPFNDINVNISFYFFFGTKFNNFFIFKSFFTISIEWSRINMTQIFLAEQSAT